MRKGAYMHYTLRSSIRNGPLACTFAGPGAQGAGVVDDVVEGERDDEEGAVAGRVHLEGDVLLVQTHRLPLLGERRLKQLTRHLEGGGSLLRKPFQPVCPSVEATQQGLLKSQSSNGGHLGMGELMERKLLAFPWESHPWFQAHIRDV
jgi:hypothetical protein